MKDSYNTNEVNPTSFTLFDLDDYLDHNVDNVLHGPIGLFARFEGYAPLGSWKFDQSYVPTPTSAQIPSPCNAGNTFYSTCERRPNNAGVWKVETSNLVAGGTDVYEQIEDVVLQTPIIAEQHTYQNESSLQQAYVTPTYTDTVTTSTTNTTTNGCKINPKASISRKSSYKVKITDKERGFDLEVGAEYNFTNTESNTVTKTQSVTSPSFTTQVPPYTTAIVTITLNKGYYANYNVPVEVDLFGRFRNQHAKHYDPNDPLTYNYFDLYPFVELVQTCCKSCSQCVSNTIRALPDNKTVRFNGTGSFIADIASNNYVVKTQFVDNKTRATISEQVEYIPAIYTNPVIKTVTTSE
ncbi:hypothetical protein DN400_22555 [Bacillus sp. AR8-1]|uniref:ETX/MTX2 family pore-forming toxin n=1 Tax=Bacillus sp. AR8-1 TaxID=2217826 RepID=UPI0011C83C28|nr:ETX/MTX2 family pore-forming toxin [Bacillus sp. AR8-1]TXR71195.1 hypothetical protein DN400_22555 [Bacillus sp. AR8-1]